ncbi:zinc knuckle domain protein [Penicillium longicatenatum]|nr:zinc knuckle domain protein [Penicillium longicatenatum]
MPASWSKETANERRPRSSDPLAERRTNGPESMLRFSTQRKVDPQYTPLCLDGHTVAATRTAERYLGYWLDPELEFQDHREKAIEKADVSLQALRSLAGST